MFGKDKQKKRKKNPHLNPTRFMQLQQNKDKEEAVHLIVECVQNGYKEQMVELMKYGVPLDQKAKGGLSAVHAIAKEGRVEMLQMIIEHKVPGLKDILSKRDLGFVGRLKETKKMKEEIGKELDFLWKNKTKYGWRPIHLAIEGNHVSMVEQLLLLHMEENLVTTLSMSCKRKKQGQNDFRNKIGKMSPIHIAAKCGSVKVLELMWTWCEVMRENETYQPFGEQDGKGWNALHHAAAEGQEEVVKWLMEKKEMCGLDLEARSEKGHTPLLTSAFYKKANVCERLMSYKADITTTANDRMTALHIAALTDDEIIARMILKGDEDSHMKKDEKGNTPLHIAIKKRSTQVSELLKPLKYAMDMKNMDGYTPETIPKEEVEHIPLEIRRRGGAAVKIYKDALSQGETEIPHVKLVVLGEARHGKTSLLNLLEGLEFDPHSGETEGIECDLVTTRTVDGKSWSSEGQPAYAPFAHMLLDSVQDPPEERNKVISLTKAQVNLRIRQIFPSSPKPRGPSHQSSPMPTVHPKPRNSIDLSVQHPLPHDQARSPVPYKQVTMDDSTSVKTVGTARKPLSHPKPTPQNQKETDKPQNTTQHTRAIPEAIPTSQDMPETPPEVPLTREVSTKIQRAFSARSEGGGGGLRIQFTTYDFAGQKLYRPMHHCFITQRSMFLIAYNTREFLREEEDEKRLKHIKYWFNTVSAYTEKEQIKGKKPPVFLVGTHRGPYKGHEGNGASSFPQLDSAMVGRIEDDLSSLKDSERYKLHLMTSSPFHFVESSIEDEESSGAKALKQALEKIAGTLPFIHERYPIRWLELREKLEKEKDLVRIEKVRKLLNFKERQIDLALKFFHDIGIITYPCVIPSIFLSEEEREKLKDVILCGPQHLADKMKELIQPHKHIDDLDADESDLLDKNIVSGSSLQKIFFGEGVAVNDEYLEYICLFLRAYGLLFPIGKEGREELDSGKTQNLRFFVPCCLKYLPEKFGTPPLALRRCFSFEFNFNGYLPEELFVRFICMAASKATSKLNSSGTSSDVDYHLTRNYCNVDSWKDQGDSWEIWHNSSTLKVFVKPPHRPPTDKKAHRQVLSEFTLFVVEKVHRLCAGLRATSLPYSCGKHLYCDYCSKRTFHKMEGGKKESPLVLKCSCTRAVSLEDELCKELRISQLEDAAKDILRNSYLYLRENLSIDNDMASKLFGWSPQLLGDPPYREILFLNDRGKNFDAFERWHQFAETSYTADRLKVFCECLQEIGSCAKPKVVEVGRKMLGILQGDLMSETTEKKQVQSHVPHQTSTTPPPKSEEAITSHQMLETTEKKLVQSHVPYQINTTPPAKSEEATTSHQMPGILIVGGLLGLIVILMLNFLT